MNDITDARESRRLEAVGSVSPAIAHDINNLLSGILGYTELLRSEPAPDHSLEHLEEIAGAARRIASLTEILLAFREGACTRKSLDLNALIRHLEKFIRQALGPDAPFSIDLDPGIPPIFANSGQLIRTLIVVAAMTARVQANAAGMIVRTGRVPPSSSLEASLEAFLEIELAECRSADILKKSVAQELEESINEFGGEVGGECGRRLSVETNAQGTATIRFRLPLHGLAARESAPPGRPLLR